MMAQRVLVTGGTGYTGSHLVHALERDGHAVAVIARDPAKARALLSPSVEIIAGDVTDARVVESAVRGRDVVYHLAAAFREPNIPDERYREVHVEATRLLLEAAREQGVSRFVHCSTVGVHSHIANPPADETWPHNPGDVYQATKSEGELLALDFQRRYDFPLAVVRPVAIYGPGEMRFLKLFRSIARRRFVMIGAGDVRLHMVHVDDLVQGLRLAADQPSAIGETFIIAGNECWSLNEITSHIAGIYGVRPPRLHLPVWPFYAAGAACEAICVPLGINPPIYRRRVAFFTKSRAFTIAKAKRLLGYEPHVPLQQGLEQTAAWYDQHGYV